MLCLKKVYADELLQLALLLSILRVNRDSFYDNIYDNLDFDNGTTWRSITPAVLRSHYVNPKSLDSVLLNYQRDLFADLNSLGRFTRGNFRHPDVTTYLLNIDRTASTANTDPLPVPSVSVSHNQSENVISEEEPNTLEMGINLTQEDMDLIEVLWKQDVDLGFTVDDIKAEKDPIKIEPDIPTSSIHAKDDDFDKFKSLQTISEDAIKQEKDEDPWSGIDYTIDTETGEYVVKEEPKAEAGEEEVEALPLPLPEFFIDEALRLIDLEDTTDENTINLKVLESLPSDINVTSLPTLDETLLVPGSTVPKTDEDVLNRDPDEDFDFFNIIQTPEMVRRRDLLDHQVPFVRTPSTEQRWQDLANLLSLNSSEGAQGMGFGSEATRGVLLQNATLPTPIGDLESAVPFNNFGDINYEGVLSNSMFLTNSSEPMGEALNVPHYKLEPPQDMLYYQNTTSEINQTENLLSSMLNDEDLQLMDMAMNEGMYTMQLLDGNSTVPTNITNTTTSRQDFERLDASSDSAVSSMGSERSVSFSDGDWGDAGSDSGHTSPKSYMTDYKTKGRQYDYSFNNGVGTSDSVRVPPVAQKKHQMYGKRFFQDSNSSNSSQSSVKYESSSTNQSEGAVGLKILDEKFDFGVKKNPGDHILHNHTYHLPAESSSDVQRPVTRDKPRNHRKSDEEHLSRDEKRAKALNVPMTVDDIINLPMDEFNERLSKFDLSEPQLSLIRDIRRRGKNKVAAQNCRKRKLDQIMSLADEVKDMKDRKMRLIANHEYIEKECKRYRDKYQQLYRHVFQNLRDSDGNQYSPYQWSLQTSADGSIILVPRSNSTLSNPDPKDPLQNQKEP